MSAIGDGLSLDQAPPLSLPARFFVTVPVFIGAAGLLLLTGENTLITPLHPHTIALTHLGTLGVLAMTMFGALYQMLPVVAGAPVPFARLAVAVHGLWVAGICALVAGLLGSVPSLLIGGGVLLSLALIGFGVPVTMALVRASADVTVWGMRVSVFSLLALALLGLSMLQGHAGAAFPGPRMPWMQAHLSVALLGWVGALIGAVSLKVVPMFYLTQPLPVRATQWALGALVIGLLGTVIALFAGANTTVLAITTAPAAIAVWLVHPAATLYVLRNRRRKRTDASVQFWQAGLSFGLLSGSTAVLALVSGVTSHALLFGWLAVWGWAGMILHGMLTRIVPFLVWFHRLSKWVGIVPVPPMRRILPDKLAQRAFWAHLASVFFGAGAILTGWPWLAKVTGLLLLAVAVLLGHALFTVFRVQEPVYGDSTTASIAKS